MQYLLSQDAYMDAISPNHLHLIILPTEKCNFRCSYCYEDFNIGRMSSQIVESIKKLVAMRITEISSIDVSWFGGEPLLAFPIISDLSKFIKNNSELNKVHYSSNMTTNGYYLNLERLNELLDLGISIFQISIDGVGEEHDKTRKLFNDKGTFDEIHKNLISARNTERDFEIILRCHYSPDNETEVLRVIDYFNKEFGNDLRFKAYFKDIERLGGENDDKILRFTNKMEHRLKNYYESLLLCSQQAYKLPNEDSYICYASKANSLIIRADGSLGKCTVALYDEINNIGKINLDGTLTINNERYKFWLNGLESLNSKTLACPYGEISQNIKNDEDRISYSSLIPLDIL